MKLYYALDLKDDPALIAEYEQWHRTERIWPEVLASVRASGIRNEEIFRAGNRMVMVIDVPDEYSPAEKAAADSANPRVSDWETLMWKYQQALPSARPGEKWVSMTRIFSLTECTAKDA